MGQTVTHKIIEAHLLSGKMVPGEEIGIRIDQTLMQDATGTMVMLELEAMGTKQVKTDISCQYVDHNILQTDFKNADDHVFLQSACRKFGIHFSRPGNGVSHPVHMENFGKPGKTMLGSDSHTCAGGSMGMLAIGAGGLEVALATIGEPFYVKMPKVVGVKLTGEFPDWISAKDICLEMLRRLDVDGGVGKVMEYYGPGLKNLTAMDRHVIANMGAELGATGTVFPADENLKEFLRKQGREGDFVELKADPDAEYDDHIEINLSELEPLIACPTSPGNVVPVSQVAGKPVAQCMVGSSANPGLRDFAIAGLILQNEKVSDHVSFDIIPSSRQILQNLAHDGQLEMLLGSGARIHQAGCNGCIGMGQAPPTGKISLRTVPRNFPGRSGTKGDQVYLCSPEVASASAITGVITDPRTLGKPYPKYQEPTEYILNPKAVLGPSDMEGTKELEMGPNIKPLPKFDPLEDHIKGPVLLKMGDNVSTDEILPAGTKVLPFRSNIPEISKFTLSQIDENYYERAMPHQKTGSILVGGNNYGQGSSREHAAIAPRYLGVRAVVAKGYARIHRKNLINFGILPLEFENEKDYEGIDQEDVLEIQGVHDQLKARGLITVRNVTKGTEFPCKNTMSEKEQSEVIAGSLINVFLAKHS